MSRPRLVGLAGAALLCALTGCGAPPGAPPSPAAPSESAAPTSSPFPPRPADLHLEGVDPCALLTTAEQGGLGVHLSGRDQEPSGPGTVSCTWFTDASPPRSWSILTAVNGGAPTSINSPAPTRIVQINNFGATEGALALGSADGSCIQLIDIAQGQNLQVAYNTFDNPIPGMNHQVACQMATRVSQYAIQNLRSRAH